VIRRRLSRASVLAALLLGGCGAAELERLQVESSLLGRGLEQGVYDPGEPGRPLLVLLHGRGSEPDDVWTLGLAGELERLGDRAPAVLLVNGGDHSYFHDRRDGRWGTYVLEEAIPAALRRLRADPARVAIGGISMGGFGAFDLARLHPDRFCAVGGHSPAVWRTGGETPAGAFDDAEDFARHDLFGGPYRGRASAWIDVGRDDPFHDAATAYGRLLREHGRSVALHVWPGGHDRDYWKAHLRQYLAFYANALERC
jgi:S-formylglutathione hydrolase FrmB